LIIDAGKVSLPDRFMWHFTLRTLEGIVLKSKITPEVIFLIKEFRNFRMRRTPMQKLRKSLMLKNTITASKKSLEELIVYGFSPLWKTGWLLAEAVNSLIKKKPIISIIA
jgi:hypothetical protein